MQDQSLFTGNQHRTISEGLQNFIDSMVDEIVIEGKPFDTQKKYLKKFSENEGLAYERRKSQEQQAKYEQQLAEQKRQQEAQKAAEEEQKRVEKEIKSRLNEYFTCLDNNRIEDLKNLFAPMVDRFQNARNISRETVVQTIKKDDANSGILSKNSRPRWNTLEVKRLGNGGFFVVLEEDFEIDRVDKNKFTKFVLKNEVEFDQYYNITSIYQNTIERY